MLNIVSAPNVTLPSYNWVWADVTLLN